MSAISPIPLNNGVGNYPDLTFDPQSSSGPAALYQSSDLNDTIDGRPSLKIQAERKQGGLNKVRIVVTVPFMETVGNASASGYVAAPKVAYYMRSDVVLMLPSRSTDDQRAYLLSTIRSLLDSAVVSGVVQDVATPY